MCSVAAAGRGRVEALVAIPSFDGFLFRGGFALKAGRLNIQMDCEDRQRVGIRGFEATDP